MKQSSPQKSGKKQPGNKYFEHGLALWDEGNVEEALAEFKKAVEHGFENDSIENDIGACLDKLGIVEEARKHYAVAVQLNPYNYFALKNLGLSYLTDDQFREVEDYLSKCLALDPSDYEVRIALGRALVELDKVEKAVRLVRPVINRSKSNEEILGALEVMQAADAYLDIYRLKDDLSKEALEMEEVLNILGETCFEMGLGNEAVIYYRQLVGRDANPIYKSWLGMALMSSGKVDEGLRILHEAEAEGGNQPQVLQNLAFALHGADMLEEALAVYRRSTDLMPNDWVLWNNWGNALYNLGRYSESIPKFVVALEKNPDYEIAWNNIGNALEKMKMHEESLPFHLRAIEIDDTFAYAHYAAAVAFVEIGNDKKAEAELRRSIELRPTFSEIWLLKTKRKLLSSPEEALAFAEKAVESDPDSVKSLILLGIAKLMTGIDDEAETDLRMARNLADAQEDRESIELIDELLEKGPLNSDKLIELLGIKPEPEEEKSDIASDESDDSVFWYRLGSDMISRKKHKRALDAFMISHEMDRDSAAALTMLLKLETDRSRLREHIRKSDRLKKMQLSTPELDKAADVAMKRLGSSK